MCDHDNRHPSDLDHHDVFWGEMSPCEHVVQFYESDNVFLDTLEGFVAGGLRSGEGVIVIATEDHLHVLEARLRSAGIDVGRARASGQYVRMETDDAMARFMVEGWPDQELFEKFVSETVRIATGPGRRVRAFGEMVAVMWGRGQGGATVRLEHLWHSFCKAGKFSLFCAYPRIGFTEKNQESAMQEISDAHTRVLGR